VAEALAEYLCARPQTSLDHVFLREGSSQHPISPAAVTRLVAVLLRETGVTSRPHGPHALRHAFAKRLLADDTPFQAIADLLGHRSLDSTATYAKVDIKRLREVPLEWPEVSR
jgi:site-specific recombinase XerD